MTGAPEYGDLSYTLAGVRRQNPYDRRRRFAQQMMQSGMDFSPVQHPLQGVARLAQAIVGGWMGGQADRDEEAAAKKQQDAFATAMSETDPQKRISMIAAVDPALGARLSGQLAIEQHKLGQQREGLQTAAGNFGASYGAPSGGGYQGTLAGLESSNNPTAVNPQSGAAGTYQFMPATWQDVRGQRPDLNLPGSPTQASPQQQGQAEQHFRQNNARALQSAGVPVNDMTLYVAHRAGADGARAILGADPNAPMSSIVPAKWIEQNPDMRGTVGQFLSLAQQRFGGGNAQRPTPLTINMTPGGPSNAPQPQIPQGDNAGMPPAPSPQAVSGPVLQAPQVPEVPRPMPTQQQLAQYQQRLASGEFGSDPRTAPAAARAALEAELDRQHGILRDEAKMRFAQQDREYGEQRKVQREQENPKFTEDQNKAHAYALRISKALPLLEGMTNDPQGMPGVIDRGVVNLPVVGNMFSGPRGQGWDQASRDLVNAILRRESGATITDAEFANAYKQYIPQPGDRPETIQQKMANVRTQLKAFADTAGRAPDVYSMGGQKGATIAGEPIPLPANSAPAPGYVEQGYRFKGGNPADQRNWERVQ